MLATIANPSTNSRHTRALDDRASGRTSVSSAVTSLQMQDVPILATVIDRSSSDTSGGVRTACGDTVSAVSAACAAIAAAAAASRGHPAGRSRNRSAASERAVDTGLTPSTRVPVSIESMARQVDGIWLPERVSGHPALELNNTVGGWRYPEPREYLLDYRTVLTLARDVEVISASESRALLAAAATPHARQVLREIKRLRNALHTVALTDSADAAAELHHFVMTAVRASRYTRDNAGTLRLDGGTGPRMPLHRFALSLNALLEQQPRSAIRACADERCGWLFLDPSGRRRWCEMAVCGNRAKARRYTQRHYTPTDQRSEV